MLMPGASPAEAHDVAERLRSNVTESAPGGLRLTMSVGVASASGAELRYEELFREADAALLQAKREGRDRVIVASGEGPDVPPSQRATVPEPGPGATEREPAAAA